MVLGLQGRNLNTEIVPRPFHVITVNCNPYKGMNYKGKEIVTCFVPDLLISIDCIIFYPIKLCNMTNLHTYIKIMMTKWC